MKLIQVVLLILARRLNVLDRWVPVEAPSYKGKLESGKNVSISEMKIRAYSTAGMLKSKDNIQESEENLQQSKVTSSTYALGKKDSRSKKETTEKGKTHTKKLQPKTSREDAQSDNERSKEKIDISSSIKKNFFENKVFDKEKIQQSKETLDTHAVPLSKEDLRFQKDKTEKEKTQDTQTSRFETQSSKQKLKPKRSRLSIIKKDVKEDEIEKGKTKALRIKRTTEEAQSGKQTLQANKPINEDDDVTHEQDESSCDERLVQILSELKRLPEEKWSASDLQEEKLLVDRSTKEIAKRSTLVTQENFQKLVERVIELQNKYNGTDVTPDSSFKKIGKELQRRASLSDAKGAIQLSAYMDKIEATTKHLFKTLHELVINKVKQNKAAEKNSEEAEEQVIGEKESESDGGSRIGTPSFIFTTDAATERHVDTQPATEHVLAEGSSTSMGTTMPSTSVTQIDEENSLEAEQRATFQGPKKNITRRELETAMWNMYDDCFKDFLKITKHCNSNIGITKEHCAKYGEQLKNTYIAHEVIEKLETKIKKFTSRIDEFDIYYRSMVTGVQEQLSRMHQDLESSLMNFFAQSTRQPRRRAAISDLTNDYVDLNDQFENVNALLQELLVRQNELSDEFSAIWKKIEVIKGVKATRQGLMEDLACKASIQEINGYIKLIQGLAMHEEYLKRVKHAYEKFNTQEIVWQIRIDDLSRFFNEKVDSKQLEVLLHDSRILFRMIGGRLDNMIKFVGDSPRVLDKTRLVRRTTDCISCGLPVTKAMKDSEKENKDPNILENRVKGEQIRDIKQRKGKESGVCFPGLPLPHARDPRSRVCSKLCGSTVVQLPSLDFKQLRKEGQEKVKREHIGGPNRTPCIPCNKQPLPPIPGHSSQGAETLWDEINTNTDAAFRV